MSKIAVAIPDETTSKMLQVIAFKCGFAWGSANQTIKHTTKNYLFFDAPRAITYSSQHSSSDPNDGRLVSVWDAVDWLQNPTETTTIKSGKGTSGNLEFSVERGGNVVCGCTTIALDDVRKIVDAWTTQE